MELILKSNNRDSLAKIITLAKKLKVVIGKNDVGLQETSKEALKNKILNFKAKGESSFGDAAKWEKGF